MMPTSTRTRVGCFCKLKNGGAQIPTYTHGIGDRRITIGITPRCVQLVVADSRRPPADISDFLGIQPDRQTSEGRPVEGAVSRRPAHGNSWELRQSEDGGVDVSELLVRIFERIYPLQEEPFSCYHDDQWKMGYYDPNSKLFVAKTADGNLNTVMTNVDKSYIDRLQRGR